MYVTLELIRGEERAAVLIGGHRKKDEPSRAKIGPCTYRNMGECKRKKEEYETPKKEREFTKPKSHHSTPLSIITSDCFLAPWPIRISVMPVPLRNHLSVVYFGTGTPLGIRIMYARPPFQFLILIRLDLSQWYINDHSSYFADIIRSPVSLASFPSDFSLFHHPEPSGSLRIP